MKEANVIGEDKLFQEIGKITDKHKNPYAKMCEILSLVENPNRLKNNFGVAIYIIFEHNKKLAELNTTGDLRLKIWDRYYEKIERKEEWRKSIIEKLSRIYYFADRLDCTWLTKFMECIERKNNKEANFTAQMISRLIEAGVFLNKKDRVSFLYTISRDPDKCMSFFADEQWSMFSEKAQKELVATLNAITEKDHAFFKLWPIEEEMFAKKRRASLFFELEYLIKIDTSMFLLNKRGIKTEIDDESVTVARKLWAFFYDQQGGADVWQKTEDEIAYYRDVPERIEEFKKKRAERVNAARNYKFQYFTFSEPKDTLVTALQLLKAKLLSLVQHLKTS